jgi:phosphoglycolate phosphatase
LGKKLGIIFDMDNTLLQSNIDYAAMKRETYDYLTDLGILPPGIDLKVHTTSTIIVAALQTGRMNEEQIDRMWDIAKRHELSGMRNAELEPGLHELLGQLHGRYILSIVTNNAYAAARTALTRHHIFDLFDCVVGREQAGILKPSPAGFLRVLEQYPESDPAAWISIGDSWIDGKASQEAGIPFVLYRGKLEQLHQHEVHPVAQIGDIRELVKYLS